MLICIYIYIRGTERQSTVDRERDRVLWTESEEETSGIQTIDLDLMFQKAVWDIDTNPSLTPQPQAESSGPLPFRTLKSL